MVEARDQVLMTLFSPASFITRILASRRGWTKGPFFRLLLIDYSSSCSKVFARGRYFLRRRMNRLLEAFFLLRVRCPLVGTPHGVTGWRPADLFLPSPPPCGWSTGFMAVPRTVGRLPSQRLRPALPIEMPSCSALPPKPLVALPVSGTMRISEEGIRRIAYRPSFAMSWIDVPADRAIAAPLPGCISTACTTVPVGMSLRARQLPGLMSEPGPEVTVSPTASLPGARM